MKTPKPYRLADQTIERLNKSAVRLKTDCKKKLLVSGFDELSVMQYVTAMYAELDGICRRLWKKLWLDRYIEMFVFLGQPILDDDEIDELVEMELAGLLGSPNGVTHYVYNAEILRKRDRAIEDIISEKLRIKKQGSIDKAIRIWSQMKNWYTDEVSDSANISAIKKAGYKYVKWHTQGDGYVCGSCKKHNGKIYSIDEIPQKPHPNCRCWVSPVKV